MDTLTRRGEPEGGDRRMEKFPSKNRKNATFSGGPGEESYSPNFLLR
jgi:hypothetical protein